MKIAIRIDGIAPEMDFEKFERFKAILDKYDIKPLIGVVPDNKDKKLRKCEPRADFWGYIKNLQNQGWIVAMHGYNHVYNTRKPGMFPVSDKSEFAGLSYQRQDEMIREGKRIFRKNGINTDFFMAPFHSYDKYTLKALRTNGFHRIADGFGDGPYELDGMTFFPVAISKSRTLASKEDGIVTFVYHIGTMTNRDFDVFEKLFEKGDIVSFDEFDKYEIRLRTLREETWEYMTARAKYYAVYLRRNLAKK